MRAIGNATVTFGMVAIPVKVYSATDTTAAIRFNQLHTECLQRVKQKLHCEACERDVTRDEIVKGFEYVKGQYVTFDDGEIKAMQEDSTKAITISEFIPITKVDPLYYSKPYYLGCDPKLAGPYGLLIAAMRKSKMVALGQYSVRGRENLVLLRATDRGLAMHQLVYAHELREQEQMPVIEVNDAELGLALQFVEALAVKSFDPSKYGDSVRERQLAAIEQKAKEGRITVPSIAPPKAQILDLAAALKASIEASTKPTKKAAPKRSRKKKAS